MSYMSELDIVRQNVMQGADSARHATRVSRVRSCPVPVAISIGSPWAVGRDTRAAARDTAQACHERMADVKSLLRSGCLDDSSQVILEAAVSIVENLDGKRTTASQAAAALADGFDMAWEILYGDLFSRR
jgi:hypothetical protein